MKYFITILFLSLAAITYAQDSITKYYDSKWSFCEKEKAVYYAVFRKAGDHYECKSYWADKGTLRGRSTYADTLMSFPVGEQVLYFKNGKLEDSGHYSNEGHTIDRVIYYPNGQLALRYSKTPGQEKESIEAYEQDGRKIKNYIYEKEAAFKGGQEAWAKYLVKNAGIFHSPDEKTYVVEVKIQFVVSTLGFATQVKIMKSSGVKAIDNDARRLIIQSPQWENAIQYNKPVIAYRIAPITYQLEPAVKKK